MVEERSEEIKEELADYLAARKRKRFSLKGIFAFSPELKPYREDKRKLEEVAVAAEEVEAAEKLEEEYEAEKENLFDRILKSVGLKKKEPVEEEAPVAQPLLDDMKTLAKISLNVIKKLPLAEMRKFKESEEFVKLKELLRKHSLIK